MRARVAFVLVFLAAAACGVYGSSEPGGAPASDGGADAQTDAASPSTTVFVRGFTKQTLVETDTFDVARPPGTQAGDLLVLFVYWAGPPNLDPFKVVGRSIACGASNLLLTWATYVASDEDEPTFNLKTSVDQPGQAVLLAIAGANGAQPLDDSANALVESGPLVLDGVSVQHDADLLVHAFSTYVARSTWPAPAGATAVASTEGLAVFTSVAARGKTVGETVQPQPSSGCSTGVVLAIAPR